jgi:hypothetical protein
VVDHPAQVVPRQGDGHPADADPVGPAAQEVLADPVDLGVPVDRPVPAALVGLGARPAQVDPVVREAPVVLVDRRRPAAGRRTPARTRCPARRGSRSRLADARSGPASAHCR